jgi:hypothetical protein
MAEATGKFDAALRRSIALMPLACPTTRIGRSGLDQQGVAACPAPCALGRHHGGICRACPRASVMGSLLSTITPRVGARPA